mmetsp:Transcript_66650/g.147762  ORF Transcript_66650/g.147762 Transcript_66650/m.147762 type:complete len:100 (-) Transcript_66650:630-929(-)
MDRHFFDYYCHHFHGDKHRHRHHHDHHQHDHNNDRNEDYCYQHDCDEHDCYREYHCDFVAHHFDRNEHHCEHHCEQHREHHKHRCDDNHFHNDIDCRRR